MRTLAVALLAFTALPAQVYVVDVAGGAGSHFTDLAAAVAAVPNGSTLRVRAGSYVGCALQAKGLAIVGEGLVVVQGSCSVALTLATQRVLLRNLQFDVGLSIRDAAGPVAVEACTIQGLFASGVKIERGAQVRLQGCQLGPLQFGFGPPLEMTDATVEVARCQVIGGTGFSFGYNVGVLALRSRCTLVDCPVTGGAGGAASCWRGTVMPATPGYPACDLEASTLLVCDSAIVGGAGGVAAACAPPAAGGVGVKAGTNCAVFVFGALPIGGGAGGGNGLPRAPGYQLGAGSRLVHSPTLRTPVAWITGTQARAQTVQVELRAAPASVAVIAFSYTGLAVPLEPFGVGSLLLQPALVSAAFAVPSTGAFALPLHLPASLPLSEIYTGQVLTWQPAGVFASNTFALLVAQ